jgi:hypothetical protein
MLLIKYVHVSDSSNERNVISVPTFKVKQEMKNLTFMLTINIQIVSSFFPVRIKVSRGPQTVQ